MNCGVMGSGDCLIVTLTDELVLPKPTKKTTGGPVRLVHPNPTSKADV